MHYKTYIYTYPYDPFLTCGTGMTWPVRQSLLTESVSKGFGDVRHVSLMHIEVTLSSDPWVFQGLGGTESIEKKLERSRVSVMDVER